MTVFGTEEEHDDIMASVESIPDVKGTTFDAGETLREDAMDPWSASPDSSIVCRGAMTSS